MGSNKDLTELLNLTEVFLCYFSEKVCYEDFLDKIKDRMGEFYAKTTFIP